ncbi:MAG: hypothetical protein V1717_04460 [Candidatus Micrarchaeota archaeon]
MRFVSSGGLIEMAKARRKGKKVKTRRKEKVRTSRLISRTMAITGGASDKVG